MLINTHFLIGKYCYDICNEKYDLNIDRKSFLWGCIEPDMHKRGNKIKHTYSVSKEQMKYYRECIENDDLTEKEISFIIGKIAHYIADCFCKYHLDEYYGKDMMKHFKYEVSLHRAMKKGMKNNDKIFQEIANEYIVSGDYLKELKGNREQYLSLEEDCLNDIYYTLKTTCQLLYGTQHHFAKIKESFA